MNIENVYTDSIRIGLSNGVVLFQLTPILTKFHENYPDIRPDIKFPGYNAILNLFLENKLDILFYYKESMPHYLPSIINKICCLILSPIILFTLTELRLLTAW